jgi:hypothetical protein
MAGLGALMMALLWMTGLVQRGPVEAAPRAVSFSDILVHDVTVAVAPGETVFFNHPITDQFSDPACFVVQRKSGFVDSSTGQPLSESIEDLDSSTRLIKTPAGTLTVQRVNPSTATCGNLDPSLPPDVFNPGVSFTADPMFSGQIQYTYHAIDETGMHEPSINTATVTITADDCICNGGQVAQEKDAQGKVKFPFQITASTVSSSGENKGTVTKFTMELKASGQCTVQKAISGAKFRCRLQWLLGLELEHGETVIEGKAFVSFLDKKTNTIRTVKTNFVQTRQAETGRTQGQSDKAQDRVQLKIVHFTLADPTFTITDDSKPVTGDFSSHACKNTPRKILGTFDLFSVRSDRFSANGLAAALNDLSLTPLDLWKKTQFTDIRSGADVTSVKVTEAKVSRMKSGNPDADKAKINIASRLIMKCDHQTTDKTELKEIGEELNPFPHFEVTLTPE